MPSEVQNALGLVLTGGGARGAYQAGVLKRIGEIKHIQKQGNPFPIITGISAGAINGSVLAAACDDFASATKVLADIWSDLKPSDIFHCDVPSQIQALFTWIWNFSLGGLLGPVNTPSLLDASPLRAFLDGVVRYGRIQENIKRGHLYGLAISATDYTSGKSYIFIEGQEGHPVWNKRRRTALATCITVEHICASAAIPFLFRPVKLMTPHGPAFFGDGCLRPEHPLSPAIRLGAESLLAIGAHCHRRGGQPEDSDSGSPSLPQVARVLLDMMFLDHLATDVEHLERLNRCSVSSGECQVRGSAMHDCEELRPLKAITLMPSVDLSAMAEPFQRAMPYLLRHVVNSLGDDVTARADLLSYLMFTSEYTTALIDIGYDDATKRIDEIESFLYAPERAGKEASAGADGH